jgi:hypothetical protein
MQNRQVFGLYRLNEQIFPALECYLKFSLKQDATLFSV